MCGRYVLTQDHAKSLLAQLGVSLEATSRALPPSRYNLPPGGPILAVRVGATKPTPDSAAVPEPADAAPRLRPPGAPDAPGAPAAQARTQTNTMGWFGPSAPASPGAPRELAWLHWGLTPAWAGPDARPLTNARAETLGEKPSFRRAFQSRRCLVPASGFYEWQVNGRLRQPWLFRRRDEQPFAFAALWETYRTPEGQILEACALITTAANALMQPVHHRMPAILLDPSAWTTWLDPQITSADTLAALLRPLPADALSATPVSGRVNQVRHDDPACLEPAIPGSDGDSPAADAAQLSLGF